MKVEHEGLKIRSIRVGGQDELQSRTEVLVCRYAVEYTRCAASPEVEDAACLGDAKRSWYLWADVAPDLGVLLRCSRIATERGGDGGGSGRQLGYRCDGLDGCVQSWGGHLVGA